VLAAAERAHQPVRLGLTVPHELAGLPWEALPRPDGRGPLALHPLVSLFRKTDAASARLLIAPLACNATRGSFARAASVRDTSSTASSGTASQSTSQVSSALRSVTAVAPTERANKLAFRLAPCDSRATISAMLKPCA